MAAQPRDDLDEERRLDFFRVMHGDKVGGRKKTAAAAARAAALSTNDVAELQLVQLPTHRDETAATLRAAKLRAAFAGSPVVVALFFRSVLFV